MQKLELATIVLLEKERFYGELIQRMRKIKTTKIPTAGVSVTDKINLYYNEDFVNTLSLVEIAELLKHECAHIFQDHIGRGKQFGSELNSNKAKRLNIAADAAINHDLTELTKNLGVTIPRLNEQLRQIDPKWVDLDERQTTEHYYGKLTQFGQDNKDAIDKVIKEMGQTDDHSIWDESEESDELRSEIIKQEVNKAVEASGGIGNLSSNIALHIQNLNKSKVNWKQQLRQFFVNSTYFERESTRKKRNRRYGTLFSGKKKKPALKIAILVDESGSVSNQELEQFYGEIKAIHTMVQPEIWVIQMDTEAKNVYKYDPKVKVERRCQGGTYYMPGINKAVELEVDAMIILGDGDCADQLTKPKIPVLWALVRNAKNPSDFGKVIHIETEDKRR